MEHARESGMHLSIGERKRAADDQGILWRCHCQHSGSFGKFRHWSLDFQELLLKFRLSVLTYVQQLL